MYSIREFKLDDYEKLVDMLYDFHCEVYTDRKIGSKYFFYKEVIRWINSKKDIVVGLYKDDIIGFTVASIDELGGMTESVYQGDIAYVVPSKRKTRIGHMLYDNVYSYGKQLGLKVTATGRVANGVDKMIEKHFKAKPTYTTFEG